MPMSALGTSLAYHLHDSVYDALSANTRRLVREAQQTSRTISWAENSFLNIFLADGSVSKLTSFPFITETCYDLPTVPLAHCAALTRVKSYNTILKKNNYQKKA